jgi:sigma-E factor negative regulatory protein RseB
MKVSRSVLLLLFIMPFTSLVSAVELSPAELLDRMSHSFRELNYRGTFSFQRGDSMESLRMAHAVIDGQEYERLEYMDGDKREIIRRGHNLDCIHPGHQLVRFYQHGQGFKFSAGQQLKITDYYQVKMTGTGRVAGHGVVNIELSPKDTHRFKHRLSLDESSGLLLRTELVGARNEVLERFQFVEVTIGEPMVAADFADVPESYSAHHQEPVLLDASTAMHADDGWQVKWLPAGFTSAVTNKTTVTDDMATFTDGLSVFSVFIESDVVADTFKRGIEGRAQRGATTAYSRDLLLSGNPHRVTVVGEIPAHTAEQIAQSIVLVTAGDHADSKP